MAKKKTVKPQASALSAQVARLFAKRLNAQIAPMGVPAGVFPAMMELWAEAGLTQRDLVERLGIEQATVANTLNRMERDGLITREADPGDRRIRRIVLTERGAALKGPATGAVKRVNKAALKSLKKSERDELLRLLAKLRTGMVEAETDA